MVSDTQPTSGVEFKKSSSRVLLGAKLDPIAYCMPICDSQRSDAYKIHRSSFWYDEGELLEVERPRGVLCRRDDCEFGGIHCESQSNRDA